MSVILGPDGRPTQSQDYRKAEPPRTNDKFGIWSGPNAPHQILSLPGGGLLQFDLERLTLNDYRQMRGHYQVNASLTLLTFMMHQLDWRIECEDKKIKEELEFQLSQVWTRLIRGLSQAYWAGYSPMALEYENDVTGRRVRLDKVKDLIPEDCSVHWKEVEGYAPPGRMRPKHYIYDGIEQWGLNYPIPVENTLWYPLLMESGNYYGRKLLKPSFPAYFFSILLHLFANRYFERFGEPLPIGRAPFDDNVEIGGQTMGGREAMEQVLSAIRNRSVVVLPSDREPTTSEYEYQLEYLECVDLETEIFTQEGWKSYDQLEVGEQVLTLDHESGLSGWQPVEAVNVHEVEDREVVRMEGTTHSSLTTLNHRWPVVHQYLRGGSWVGEREWRDTEHLNSSDRVPICAEHSDFPKEPKYDDDFVELVAWYWTEGYTFATGNYVSISQKSYPDRIRGALARLFGPASNAFPRSGGNGTDGVPRWRETSRANDPDSRTFFLSYDATKPLSAVAPDRIVSYDFLLSLTRPQLSLFMEVSLLADGNVTDRQTFLMQKDRRKAERFQFVCTLLGHATSIYPLSDKRHDDYVMWVVSVRRSASVNPVTAHRGNGPFKIWRERYTGKVWCPTTPNGTWLARRRGTVYFTGNSQMRGADFERYMNRLDEEISLGMFTPVLLFRTADVGSYNLGVQHMQVWMWMLNALAGDLKEYLEHYLLERLKAINFSPRAPKVTWRYRKMGKEHVETIRAVVTELLRDQRLQVGDYEELGQYVGLDLKEVRQLAGDDEDGDEGGDEDGDPQVDPRVGRSREGATRPRTERGRAISAGRSVVEDVVRRIEGQYQKAKGRGALASGNFTPKLGFRGKFRAALEAHLDDAEAQRVTECVYHATQAWVDEALEVSGAWEGGGFPEALRSVMGRELERTLG